MYAALKCYLLGWPANRSNSGNCSCERLLVIFVVVGIIGLAAPSEDQVYSPTSWNSSADPSNKGLSVLDQIEQNLRSRPVKGPAAAIFPGLPDPRESARPYDDSPGDLGLGLDTWDFRSTEGAEYYWILTAVEPADRGHIALRLADVSRTALYGCFERIRKYQGVTERACRFVRSINFTNGHFVSTPEQSDFTPMTQKQTARIAHLKNLTDEERTRASSADLDFWRSMHLISSQRQTDGTWKTTANYFPTFKYSFDQANGSGVMFPLDWFLILRDQRLKTLWVDCSVRVDTKGFPITVPDSACRPVALQTDRFLYVAIQKKAVSNDAGLWGAIFGAKTFDVSRATDPLSMAQKVVQKFIAGLEKRFSERPLVAGLDRSETMPPGEYLFRRDFDWSYVLNTGFKGPYFERSAYLVRWWSPPPGADLIAADESEGVTKGGSIYVKVSHSLQIGKGKAGEYPDPTPDQAAEYKRVVQKIILELIRTTTSELHGHMQGEVGVFGGDLQ